MSRKQSNSVGSLLTALLLIAGWRIYTRRSTERIPSPEGIDDPEISGAFNRIAGMAQMRWMREYVAARAAALKTDGQVIDLGCGPGQLVVQLARRAPNMQITGVDLSQAMLDRAGTFAWESGVGDRVAFRMGDAQSIPFPDASLDLVVSTLSLHHWADPQVVFDEIDRVLKPGGAYLIFDLRRDLAAPFYLLLWAATQFIVPAALHRINEPMGSRNAAYTPRELAVLAMRSKLSGWQVALGPLWVILEGRKS